MVTATSGGALCCSAFHDVTGLLSHMHACTQATKPVVVVVVQSQRLASLAHFKSGHFKSDPVHILVATDVASRFVIQSYLRC